MIEVHGDGSYQAGVFRAEGAIQTHLAQILTSMRGLWAISDYTRIERYLPIVFIHEGWEMRLTLTMLPDEENGEE